MFSTSHSNITQPSQTHRSPRQVYDPPSIPPQFSTSNNTQDSPQQGSSNTQHTNTVHFQTPTPPSPPQIQTSTYTPAQNNPIQNVQTGLNINTIHSYPPFNYTTYRHLSRPPLQVILTNPLSYNLTSTNPSHTQQSQTKNNRPISLNTFPSQHTSKTITPTLQTSQFIIQNPPSTIIRTNPHFHNTDTQTQVIHNNLQQTIIDLIPLILLLLHKLLIQPLLHNKTHIFNYQIPLQQISELTLTFITHQRLLLQIIQMFLHTIQYNHLQYLKVPFHNRHILTLQLQYQNLLNVLAV